MDTNQQNGSNNNLATSEIKIWLPPTYTNNKISTPQTSTNNSSTTPSAPEKRRWGFLGKTKYERLMLIFTFFAAVGAIAIPILIYKLGVDFTQQQAQLSTAADDKQHQTDLQIAQDQQRETLLEKYIANLQDLLLSHNLRNSNSNDEIRQLARTQTLTTLRNLDSKRKAALLLFLYESNLIKVPQPIINLAGADLSGIILQGEFCRESISVELILTELI